MSEKLTSEEKNIESNRQMCTKITRKENLSNIQFEMIRYSMKRRKDIAHFLWLAVFTSNLLMSLKFLIVL